MNIENVEAFVLAQVAAHRDDERVVLWELDDDGDWRLYDAQMIVAFGTTIPTIKIFDRLYTYSHVKVNGKEYTAITRKPPKRDLEAWKVWWLKGLENLGIPILTAEEVGNNVKNRRRSVDYM